MNSFHHQPRTNGVRSIANENAEMVDFTSFTGLYKECNLCTLPLQYKVMVDTTACNQCG
jgi:hypothetical protein